MNRESHYRSSGRISDEYAMRPSALDLILNQEIEYNLLHIEEFFNNELERDDPILKEQGIIYLTDKTEYMAFPFCVSEDKLKLVRTPDLISELKIRLLTKKIEGMTK
jgi:hypothetical protein